MSPIQEINHKSIMWLIFMRTLLELCVEYSADGKVVSHTLTANAKKIYDRITTLERTIYRKSDQLKKIYLEAHELSKGVWSKSLDAVGSEYEIYIEPIVSTLYTEHEKELTKLGLFPKLFMLIYDSYYEEHDCALEVESITPVDIIVKETERAIFEFKKINKRK